MEGLVRTFEIVCHGLSAERAGVLLRPESFVLDFDAGKPIAIRKVRAAFATAGRELVSRGRISPETEREASAPLTRDLALFEGHARVYWDLARGRSGAFDRAALGEEAASDLRILVPELAASLDPSAAGDLDAAIQLDVAGDPRGGFHLRIARGRCAAQRGRHDRPDATIALDAATLVALIRGTIDPRAEIARGGIRVSGDRSLFARFARLFPRS
jgi:hypothetical protein